MKFRFVSAIAMTSPDELITVLKRYFRESNESEIVVASRIGVRIQPVRTLAQLVFGIDQGTIAANDDLLSCAKSVNKLWTTSKLRISE